MGQKRIWLGTSVMDHKYGHTEDPKYGQEFRIVAIQLESIDKEKFTDWIENGNIQFDEEGTQIDFSEYLNDLRKMGENNQEWKKTKNKISDDVCKDLNTLIGMCLQKITPVKEVAAYKVHYVEDPEDVYQVL